MKKQEIIKKIKENKENIKKFSVKKIGLFGSHLKGDNEKDSDIDFLIKFKDTNADNYFNLLFLLEKIFNKKIDLIVESGLKPEVKYVKNEAEYIKI